MTFLKKAAGIQILTKGLVAACATIFALVMGTVAPASAADLTVRFAWYMPAGTATDDQGNEIAKKIQEYSKGTIDVKTYPAGSLLTEKNMGDGIRNQTAQMGILGMHWWSNVEPSLQWDNIPFFLTDPDVGLKALHGTVGADIKKILARHNIAIVGWGYYGYGTSFINNKHAVRTPQDLSGLAMRGDGPLTSAFIQKFGGNPVALSSNEVYTALQRGTINGAASGLPSFVTRRWIEVAKHVTALQDLVFVYPIQANLAWWNSLTTDQRSVISKAVADTEEDNVKAIKAAWDKDLASLKAAGGDIVKPEGKELQAWKDGSAFAKDWYIEHSGDDGKKFVADMQQFMATQ